MSWRHGERYVKCGEPGMLGSHIIYMKCRKGYPLFVERLLVGARLGDAHRFQYHFGAVFLTGCYHGEPAMYAKRDIVLFNEPEFLRIELQCLFLVIN